MKSAWIPLRVPEEMFGEKKNYIPNQLIEMRHLMLKNVVLQSLLASTRIFSDEGADFWVSDANVHSRVFCFGAPFDMGDDSREFVNNSDCRRRRLFGRRLFARLMHRTFLP